MYAPGRRIINKSMVVGCNVHYTKGLGTTFLNTFGIPALVINMKISEFGKNLRILGLTEPIQSGMRSAITAGSVS